MLMLQVEMSVMQCYEVLAKSKLKYYRISVGAGQPVLVESSKKLIGCHATTQKLHIVRRESGSADLLDFETTAGVSWSLCPIG